MSRGCHRGQAEFLANEVGFTLSIPVQLGGGSLSREYSVVLINMFVCSVNESNLKPRLLNEQKQPVLHHTFNHLVSEISGIFVSATFWFSVLYI